MTELETLGTDSCPGWSRSTVNTSGLQGFNHKTAFLHQQLSLLESNLPQRRLAQGNGELLL